MFWVAIRTRTSPGYSTSDLGSCFTRLRETADGCGRDKRLPHIAEDGCSAMQHRGTPSWQSWQSYCQIYWRDCPSKPARLWHTPSTSKYFAMDSGCSSFNCGSRLPKCVGFGIRQQIPQELGRFPLICCLTWLQNHCGSMLHMLHQRSTFMASCDQRTLFSSAIPMDAA